MQNQLCNRDCFHCPYEDCVVDGETALEIARSERRDKPECGGSNLARRRQRREQGRRYRAAHPDRTSAKNRRYYLRHKAAIAEYKRLWYIQNRDRILAQQKEYRKRKKEKDGTETQA